jgi:hypothetical protein
MFRDGKTYHPRIIEQRIQRRRGSFLDILRNYRLQKKYPNNVTITGFSALTNGQNHSERDVLHRAATAAGITNDHISSYTRFIKIKKINPAEQAIITGMLIKAGFIENQLP